MSKNKRVVIHMERGWIIRMVYDGTLLLYATAEATS